MQVIQYSPEPCIEPLFRKYGFLYTLENGQSGITSFNRVRGLCESLGVARVSRNIILALLARSGGFLVGEAINTYSHRSNICWINVTRFRREVFTALLSESIEGTLKQLPIFPDIESGGRPMHRSPSVSRRQKVAYSGAQLVLDLEEEGI